MVTMPRWMSYELFLLLAGCASVGCSCRCLDTGILMPPLASDKEGEAGNIASLNIKIVLAAMQRRRSVAPCSIELFVFFGLLYSARKTVSVLL